MATSLNEMHAYEALWLREKISFRKIARSYLPLSQMILPSDLVSEAEISNAAITVSAKLDRSDLGSVQTCLRGVDYNYPDSLSDAEFPIPAFYYQADISLTKTPRSLAIIGSRNASQDGIARAHRLSRMLVAEGFVILSGLAEGIDTAAHRSAITHGGRTIAVIGTAITDVYPQENRRLQEIIASDHLLISQIPVCRYSMQDYHQNRQFFLNAMPRCLPWQMALLLWRRRTILAH
jgi:DNA processing protein